MWGGFIWDARLRERGLVVGVTDFPGGSVQPPDSLTLTLGGQLRGWALALREFALVVSPHPSPRWVGRRTVSGPGEITELLLQWGNGDPSAADRLFPLVYEELRRIARGQLRLRPPNPTLGATELVHETYLKLVDQSRVATRDRGHFFALAAKAMRHILVDRARRRTAAKRGGDDARISLADEDGAEEPRALEILEIRRGPASAGASRFPSRPAGRAPLLRWTFGRGNGGRSHHVPAHRQKGLAEGPRLSSSGARNAMRPSPDPDRWRRLSAILDESSRRVGRGALEAPRAAETAKPGSRRGNRVPARSGSGEVTGRSIVRLPITFLSLATSPMTATASNRPVPIIFFAKSVGGGWESFTSPPAPMAFSSRRSR